MICLNYEFNDLTNQTNKIKLNSRSLHENQLTYYPIVGWIGYWGSANQMLRKELIRLVYAYKQT